VWSVPSEVPAAERARWLAELSEALNEAHRQLIQMEMSSAFLADARELFLRIEAARLEIQSLRLSRSLNPRQENGPERIELPSWNGEATKKA